MGMDGVALIRRGLGPATVPVTVTTATASAEAEQEARGVGASASLAKPLDTTELLDCIVSHA